MKKIINGRMYDTDTAKNRGSWWNGIGRNDFNHCSETLYSKRTGEFFLQGEGGPMSKYSDSTGDNSWSGGEAIIPLSVDAARAWAEDKLTADEYQDIFGEVSEDAGDGKSYLALYLPDVLIAKIRKDAQDQGITASAWIEAHLTA